MSTDGSKDKVRGFAGLADLAPPPPPAPPPAPPIVSNDQGREPSALNPKPETQSVPKKTKNAGKELWIIGVVALAAILIYEANSANNVGSAPASPAPAYQPPASPPPADAPPAPPAETTPVPTPAYSPAPVVESLPPQGSGLLLNDSQISYCVAQKMRLETWRSVTQDTNSADVDRFNAQINDYNSRCSSYRYQQGAQERVAGEMENERHRIESMARTGWLATTPPAPAPAPTYIPDLSNHYDTPAPAYPPIVPTPSPSSDDSDSGNGNADNDGNGNSGSDGGGNGNE
jgi:hypothetical protein